MRPVQRIMISYLFVSLCVRNLSSPAAAQGNPVQTTTVARLPIVAPSTHGTMHIYNLPLQVRPFEITGVVAMNQKGETVIVEMRYLFDSSGNFVRDRSGKVHVWHRIALFNSAGRQTSNIPLATRQRSMAGYLGLCMDGTIWLCGSDTSPNEYIRKIDRTGKTLFEFGQYPNQPVGASLRSKMTKQSNHRWGKQYELCYVNDLETDDAGRVYSILEDQSLHIFSPTGKPIDAFAFPKDRYDAPAVYKSISGSSRKSFHGQLQFIDHSGRIYTSENIYGKSNTDFVGCDIYRWNWLGGMKSERIGSVERTGCVVGTDKRGNVYYVLTGDHVVLRIEPGGVVSEVFNPAKHYAKWVADERKKWLAGMSPSEYKRTLPYRDKQNNMGPRVGHICNVDSAGRLYLTLVGAKEFRVDRITLGE